MRLKDLISAKSNDYSSIESIIKPESDIFRPSDIPESSSIIIPFFNLPRRLENTLEAIARQKYLEKTNCEVIIIDDGSEEDSYQVKVPEKLKVRSFRNFENLGPAISRNIGIYHAKNDVCIFLDSDMIPSDNFLVEHSIRHCLSDKLLLIGFKENITGLIDSSRIPNYKRDPRFFKDTEKYGLKNRKISLYEETQAFKRFGNGSVMFEDCVPGGWTLPMAIVSHSLSILRKNAIKAGGFDFEFRKPMYEDTHFGAKCLALGLYAVPLTVCASFHLDHENRNSYDQKEAKRENNRIYSRKLEEDFRGCSLEDFNTCMMQFVDKSVEIKR